MSLRDIINKIKSAAQYYPNINSFYVGDIYELNTDQSVNYASVVVTQGEHSVNTDDNTITYTLYVFYVDRQTSDADNVVMVQSHGINILTAILNRVGEDIYIENYTINVFRERFASLCAGAYAQVGITVNIDDCADYETTTTTEVPEYPEPSASWVGNTILSNDTTYVIEEWGYNVGDTIELEADEGRQLTWIIEGADRGDGEYTLNNVVFSCGHLTTVTIYNEDRSKMMRVFFMSNTKKK